MYDYINDIVYFFLFYLRKYISRIFDFISQYRGNHTKTKEPENCVFLNRVENVIQPSLIGWSKRHLRRIAATLNLNVNVLRDIDASASLFISAITRYIISSSPVKSSTKNTRKTFILKRQLTRFTIQPRKYNFWVNYFSRSIFIQLYYIAFYVKKQLCCTARYSKLPNSGKMQYKNIK